MRFVIVNYLAACSLLSLAGCERWELDRQMEDLCRKDGGVKVYETVALPASYFDNSGRIKFGPSMSLGVSKPDGRSSYRRIGNDEYRVITQIADLKKGDPSKGEGRLERVEHMLVRVGDQKVLAISVSYFRAGGDLVVIDHYSSRSCPVPAMGTSVESAIVKGD